MIYHKNIEKTILFVIKYLKIYFLYTLCDENCTGMIVKKEKEH